MTGTERRAVRGKCGWDVMYANNKIVMYVNSKNKKI